MNDYQSQLPAETDDLMKKPANNRRVSYWLFGCASLFVILVIAAGVAVFLLNRDIVDTVADLQDANQDLETAVTTRTSTDSPSEQSPADALDDSQSTAEGAPTLQATDSPEAEPDLADVSPDVEMTPTSTAESTNEPGATESPPSSFSDNMIEGRIAVVDNSSQLWTVVPDGSDRRLLSEQGQFYQFPSWSPSGNNIAVIASDSEASGIYVVADEPDSEMRQLYSDASSLPIYLYWSPDGESVSFIASHNEGLALHLAPADGSAAPELLVASPGTFFWDWMPDGSQVLIHTGFAAIDRDNSRLAMVPLDDSRLPQEIAQGGYFQAPAVAADGRYFSYGSLDGDGNRWLSIQDVEQGEQVETVRHQGVVAMAFSPTSAQLAFTSPARPNLSFYGALRIIDLVSGEPRLLVPEPVVAFFWSPDGRSIAYLTPTIIDKPFDFDDAPVAGLSGQNTRAKSGLSARAKLGASDAPGILLQPETEFGLALSTVEIESGESRLLTTFQPGVLFLDQFLPFFDQYAHSHRLWSPDSRALLLPIRNEQNQNMIIVVPADGSDPWPISAGVAAFWSQQ